MLSTPSQSKLYQRFLNKVIGFQETVTPTTRGSAVVDALKMLGMSALIWAGGFILIKFMGASAFDPKAWGEAMRGGAALLGPLQFLAPFLVIGGLLLIFVMPFISLGLVIKSLLSKEVDLACPYCGKSHKMLTSITSYVCPECGVLQRMSRGPDKTLIKAACPACASPFAASPNLSLTTCADCGFPLQLANGVVSSGPTNERCPGCSTPVGKETVFCTRCGALVTRPQLDYAPNRLSGEEWSGSKFVDENVKGNLSSGLNVATGRIHSPIGHLARAAWLAEITRSDLAAEEAIPNPKVPSRSAPQLHLFSLNMYMARLEQLYLHLIMATEIDPSLLPQAGALFAQVESLAALALTWTVNPDNGNLNSTLDAVSFNTGEKSFRAVLLSVAESHNALVDRLTAAGLEAAGKWPEPLFDIETRGAGQNVVLASITDWPGWINATRVKDLLAQARPISTAKISMAGAVPISVAA